MLRLSWATPQDPEPTSIPADSLYTLPGAANGLVGYYYTTPDWTGTPSLIQRDLFVLANNVLAYAVFHSLAGKNRGACQRRLRVWHALGRRLPRLHRRTTGGG